MPEGWCWACFLGSGFLGLPLYHRGLSVWGSLMVAFNLVVLVVATIPTERAVTLDNWLFIIGLGLCGFFGIRANRMAIDHHLAQGWEQAGPRASLL